MLNIEDIQRIAVAAGQKIMEVYNSNDFQVENKDDKSPLTLADKLSHHAIVDGINALNLGYPILSEEGDPGDFEARRGWETFWCVDPLDGTKEFLKRNGEFTVNIALIDKKHPVMGVIYVPATETLYYGDASGAFKKEKNGAPVRLSVSNRTENLVAVGSRSHSSPEEERVLGLFGVADIVSKGSSLKFCLVAEGIADVYYRHNPTMEWDTAAGQAIVEASGGVVLNKDGVRFYYNKEELRNGSFMCLGAKSTSVAWM